MAKDVTILDYMGRPVDMALLRQELSAPARAGIRTVRPEYEISGVTPDTLALWLRQAVEPGYGAAVAYLELAEVMEELDLHYQGILGTRKRAVAQIGITLEPATDDQAGEDQVSFLNEFFQREELADELFDVLDAVGKGFSVTEILWDMSERQWMPQRLVWRFPRWFDFDRDTGTQLVQREQGGNYQPLAPYKYLTLLMKAKTGLPMRGGIARSAAWAWMFKSYTMKDWIRFVEAYGNPIRIGKYQPDASQNDKDVLYRAILNLAADAACMIPEGMMVEFPSVDQPAARADVFKDLMMYIDNKLSIAVLGQTLTTEPGQSGSYSLGQVHNLVRGDIEMSDASLLAQGVRRDLVIPIIDLNFGKQNAYPKVVIERARTYDTKEIAETLNLLVPMGLKVKVDEVRSRMGYAMPEDGDDVLMAAAGAPALPSPGGPVLTRALQRALARARGGGADDAIDRAIDSITPEEWHRITAPILQPLMEAAAADPENFMGDLASLYVDMDAEELQDQLTQIIFAADVHGRLTNR